MRSAATCADSTALKKKATAVTVALEKPASVLEHERAGQYLCLNPLAGFPDLGKAPFNGRAHRA